MTDLPPPPRPSPDWAFFLDVDGTLIEIAPTPSAIHIPSELPGQLKALADRHGGAVATVSGRTIDNQTELLAPEVFPAAGLHGLERRRFDGTLLRPPPLPGLDDLRRRLKPLEGGGVVLEDKGLSLALHYRLAPGREEECRQAVAAAAADHPEFRLLAGKMVFELKPAGVDKGTAVQAFMAEPPFRGRVPVFVGDDVTDEDGFVAANRLGGFAVLVGPARPTAARYRLDDVAACRQWLFG
ncbi:MAG: trehalose-phosphatase [Solirubrobacterales bacterium]